MTIVSTRNMNVILAKKGRLLKRVTTKDIDISVKVPKPGNNPVKSPLATTGKLADIASIEEKKERDAIIAQRKSFEEGDAVYLNKKGKLVTDEKREVTLEEFAKQAGATIDSRDIPIEHKVEKKAWKDMADEEKKVEYQRRAQLAKTTREAKKNEKA